MSERTGEHGGARHVMDKMQDVAGGLVGRMSAAGVSSANTFIEKAAMGDLYEIEAARIALRRTTSPEVRMIAEKMLNDHMASAHHLGAALEMNETRGLNIPPTRELDTRHQTMIDHLEAAPQDKFDATYLDQQVLAHEETATLLSSYADKGENPQLCSLARSVLPVVERHLTHVKGLRKDMAH